jgi:hypothetical protein
MKHRDFIKDNAVSALAAGTAPHTFEPDTLGIGRSPISLSQAEFKAPFWPDGARMVVSISMQMEAGARPSTGIESSMPPIDRYARSSKPDYIHSAEALRGGWAYARLSGARKRYRG